MTYYKSFDISDEDGILNSFDEDGFVVIRDVLDRNAVENSVAEIWTYLETKGSVRRDDPETWTNENWPSEICRNGGFMGRFPYMRRLFKLDNTFINKQAQAWRNRQNPNVYKGFALIQGSPRIWMSIDRYGIMRPSLLQGSDQWKTKKEWLHWDLNPFHYATSAAGFAPADDISTEVLAKEYGMRRLQGLLTLSDCPIENGGFHCVKGFHKERFDLWREDNMEKYGKEDGVSNRNFVEVPEDDPIRDEIQQVPMKSGSLLIWDSKLPHGNFPNSSDAFRMVQYLKSVPVDDPREFKPIMSIKEERLLNQKWFPDGFEPSPLGRKLFGLEEW